MFSLFYYYNTTTIFYLSFSAINGLNIGKWCLISLAKYLDHHVSSVYSCDYYFLFDYVSIIFLSFSQQYASCCDLILCIVFYCMTCFFCTSLFSTVPPHTLSESKRS